MPIPAVVKAAGLALGKGVVIAQTRQEAENAIRAIMGDRISVKVCSRIVIEEFLTGPKCPCCPLRTAKHYPNGVFHGSQESVDNDQGSTPAAWVPSRPIPFIQKRSPGNA
jgi:phosphoribosylamine--glycine ligase